jgi:REP element-mobilizing transposase RayT
MMKHSNHLLQTNNHYLLVANEDEENAFLEPVVLKIRNRLIKVKEEKGIRS